MSEAAPVEGAPVEGTQPGTEAAPVNTEAPAGTEAQAPAGTETPGTEQGANPSTPVAEGGETPAVAPEEAYTEIIEGWKEDRQALQTSEEENRTLRDRNAVLEAKLSALGEGGTSEEDKYAGMTPTERNAAIIKDHNEAQAAEAERDKNSKAGELGFLRRTDSFFKTNEAAIIAKADLLGVDLSKAMTVLKSERAAIERATKAKEIEDKRKLEAGITPGGNNQGVVSKGGYNPDTDRGKSISQLYKEGGIS